MKIFKKLAIVLGIISALALNLSAKGSIDTIKERGKIRIGVYSDEPPYGYVDNNGKYQGFTIVIAKRLAKELLGDENKVEFISVESANRVDYLATNKVDIILANFTVTPERARKVDFANPYMKVAIAVVSPDKKPINKVEDLKGKKLIVTKGTTQELYFRKNHPEIELLGFDHNTESFIALKDGRGDAFTQDNTLLFAWVKQNAGFVVGIDSLGSQDTMAAAVKKGNKELLNWINETLARLSKEKFMEKAYNETLRPVYGDNVDPKSVIIESGEL